ncbi:MAG: hypothetical protein AAGK21_05410 [Bacteroidota bacterium]
MPAPPIDTVDATHLLRLLDELEEDINISDDEALSRIEPYVAPFGQGVRPELRLSPGLGVTGLNALLTVEGVDAPAYLDDLNVAMQPLSLPKASPEVHNADAGIPPVSGIVGADGRIQLVAPKAEVGFFTLDASERQPGKGIGALISEIFFAKINGLKRNRRNRRFDRDYKATRPLIVAEGDSWVLYPWKLRDLAEHLTDSLNVWSVGAAGDEFREMLRTKEYLTALDDMEQYRRRPDALLFSGGGNDILGDTLKSLLVPYTGGHEPGKNPERFVRWNSTHPSGTTLERVLSGLMKMYGELFDAMRKTYPDVAVVVHGYDYAETGSAREPIYALPGAKLFGYGDWLREAFEGKHICKEADQDAVIRLLIDAYNIRLKKSVDARAAAGENVHFADVRGVVRNDWANEIHPNTAGFGRVASKVLTVIRNAVPDAPPAPVV